MKLKGAPLPDGGTVGVPAPASPYFNRSELLRGVEWWEARGFHVKLGDHIDARRAYVAGSAEERAEDLMAMFADPEVDVIQVFQGGYGSAQTIPLLDFDLIAAHPKPFVGYSDITALHTALRHFAGLVTFYGPGIAGVADPERKESGLKLTQETLLRALTTTDPLGEVPRKPDDSYLRSFTGGKVTAELAGGCLWLLGQTIGTPWQVDLAGKIFFFEDVDLPAWYMDGLLTQMRQAGMLTDVAGVAIGELTRCEWREERPEWPQTLSVEDVLEQHIEPLGVPALYGLPLGHGDHLATIPLGVRAILDAGERRLTLDEAALENRS